MVLDEGGQPSLDDKGQCRLMEELYRVVLAQALKLCCQSMIGQPNDGADKAGDVEARRWHDDGGEASLL